MLAIQAGAEIGLSPMQALQSIAVVNGRPSVYGDAALAVAKASPVCEYVTETIEGEGDAMVAVCEAKRRGYPSATVVRFSVADAKKASLWGKSGPWSSYPRRMLQMRARGFALRDAFPDVLKGLVTAEEAQDYPTTEAPAVVARAQEPATVTQVAQPPAASATPEDMAKARKAIAAAKSIDRLKQHHATVSERLDAGFYTPSQASELVELIDTRIDLMTPRGDAYEGHDDEPMSPLGDEMTAEARA